MQFILIAIGIILIFIALKLNNNAQDLSNKNSVDERIVFKNLVDDNLNSNSDIKLDFIIEQIKEMNLRFDNIEDSLIVLSNKIDQISEKTKTSDTKKKRLDKKQEVSNDLKEVENNVKFDKNEAYDVNDIIYDLIQKGFSVDEICSQLNIGKGEVLLRLGLKKAKL